METQKLINCAVTTTSCDQLHGVAPVQVKLELAASLFRKRSFDESMPFLLYGRTSEVQFGATMRGLNQAINCPSVLHTAAWICVLVTWFSFIGTITVVTKVDDGFKYFYMCSGFVVAFAIISVVVIICHSVQLRRRVNEYVEETNRFYNPQGINFLIKKHFRRWELVIDILPQESSAADYLQPQQTQQQQAAFASHQTQQPLVFATSYPAGQQQPQQGTWASYSHAAYQKPSLDNV